MRYNIKKLYSGRISRRNYIFGQLFIWIVSAGFMSLAVSLLVSPSASDAFSVLAIIIGILGFVLAIPCIVLCWALHVRRFHDLGLSGYYIFLFFIPLANLIIFALFIKKGEENSNQFGEKPLKEIKFFDAIFNRTKV